MEGPLTSKYDSTMVDRTICKFALHIYLRSEIGWLHFGWSKTLVLFRPQAQVGLKHFWFHMGLKPGNPSFSGSLACLRIQTRNLGIILLKRQDLKFHLMVRLF